MEILVGRNAVIEALLAQRRQFDKIMLAEGVAAKGPIKRIMRLCREAHIPIFHVKRRDLDRLGNHVPHQGVAAQVSPYPYSDLTSILALAKQRSEPPFLLALDSLQDPQNVGSLLRTAEAVGIHGVILPSRRAAQITPAASRASAGAVEHLLVARVTNLGRTLDALKDEGTWVMGVENRPDARDYRLVDMDLPLVLVLGSEGQGMRHLITEKCDLLLRIPMRGQISSLNVSVAGSLLLYRAWNARNPTISDASRGF